MSMYQFTPIMNESFYSCHNSTCIFTTHSFFLYRFCTIFCIFVCPSLRYRTVTFFSQEKHSTKSKTGTSAILNQEQLEIHTYMKTGVRYCLHKVYNMMYTKTVTIHRCLTIPENGHTTHSGKWLTDIISPSS